MRCVAREAGTVTVCNAPHPVPCGRPNVSLNELDIGVSVRSVRLLSDTRSGTLAESENAYDWEPPGRSVPEKTWVNDVGEKLEGPLTTLPGSFWPQPVAAISNTASASDWSRFILEVGNIIVIGGVIGGA
jgi:hypothetical protein